MQSNSNKPGTEPEPSVETLAILGLEITQQHSQNLWVLEDCALQKEMLRVQKEKLVRQQTKLAEHGISIAGCEPNRDQNSNAGLRMTNHGVTHFLKAGDGQQMSAVHLLLIPQPNCEQGGSDG